VGGVYPCNVLGAKRRLEPHSSQTVVIRGVGKKARGQEQGVGG